MSEILLEIQKAIATITLNRPEKLNALAGQMRQDLLATIQDTVNDPEVRVLVLTGAGRAFCAGGDVPAMHNTQLAEDRATFTTWLELGGEIVRTLRAAPQPVIAAVNGVAAGAGCNLALACDLRYASETASFSQAFIRLGLHPDWGGSFWLPRLIGITRAAEMMFTGDALDAHTAFTLGLVNRVVPAEDLMKVVSEVAERLAVQSPLALAEIKKSLSVDGPQTLEAATFRERDVQLKLWASEESRQRIAFFLEKRKA